MILPIPNALILKQNTLDRLIHASYRMSHTVWFIWFESLYIDHTVNRFDSEQDRVIKHSDSIYPRPILGTDCNGVQVSNIFILKWPFNISLNPNRPNQFEPKYSPQNQIRIHPRITSENIRNSRLTKNVNGHVKKSLYLCALWIRTVYFPTPCSGGNSSTLDRHVY